MSCPPNQLGLQSHPMALLRWGSCPQGYRKPCFRSSAGWPNPYSSGWKSFGLLKWRQWPDSLKLMNVKLMISLDDLKVTFRIILFSSWWIVHVNSMVWLCRIYKVHQPFFILSHFFPVLFHPKWQYFCWYNSISIFGFRWGGLLSPWVEPMISLSNDCWDAPLVFFSEQTFSFFATWEDWEFSKSQIWFTFA